MSSESDVSDESAEHEREECHEGGEGQCPNRVRRRVLGAVGAGATISVAGCIGLFEEPDIDADDDEEAAEDDDDSDDDVDGDGFNVEYLEFGETIEVPEDEALLYAGLDEGWDLPYACEAGTCGQCTARVDGDANEYVEMDGNQYLEDDQIEDGWLLTCVGFPRDDFALETSVHPDDEDADDDEEAAAFDVEFTEFGETLEITEDEELLYAGLDEGWDLPYQCEAGVCGQCEAKVDGNGHDLVEMTANDVLDDDEIEEGYVLTCTGQPRDDFAIDTDP